MLMGNSPVSNKLNYQDIQFIIQHPDNYMLINTLPELEQTCLIVNTIHVHHEERMVNDYIKQGNKDIHIILYGKNCNDDKVYHKYKQFVSLGFPNVFIYIGGLFEWLLLQDIYGSTEFPTTTKEIDILKYAPNKVLNNKYLYI